MIRAVPTPYTIASEEVGNGALKPEHQEQYFYGKVHFETDCKG